MKKLFLTYGDSSFTIAKKHLSLLAKESNFFDEVVSLGPKDLDQDFKKKYSKVLAEKKGGGYWIWKHRIIKNLINHINKNDLIIYCDAGASLNYKAKKRFDEYIEIISESEYGNFRMDCESHFKEHQYTTKEIFNYFNVDLNSDISKNTQLQAGHMIFKKNQHTIDLLNEYTNLLNTDFKLITDFYSSKNQIKTFKENRHDQSIFSLLSKIYGCERIQNETEFRTRPSEQYNFPFLSVRTYGHGLKDKVRFYSNKKKYSKKIIYF